MSAIEQVTSHDLDTLAAEIRHQVEQAQADYDSAIGHAIRAGELLLAAKSQVKHGAWLPWLDANFSGSSRSARGYMRLARNAEDAQALAHLGVEGALKQLAASPEITEREVVAEVVPDRCPRCERIVRSDRPHKCMETSRHLGDAHVALRRALIDLRRYPPSTYPRTTSDDEMAATVLHLAGQVQRLLSGEPELDEATERRRKSEGVQRTIEGVGIAPCEDCGDRLAEYKGRPYCYRCESYKDGR